MSFSKTVVAKSLQEYELTARLFIRAIVTTFHSPKYSKPFPRVLATSSWQAAATAASLGSTALPVRVPVRSQTPVPTDQVGTICKSQPFQFLLLPYHC